jgi:tetratricopeptide (TPR) repeat protein
MWYPLTTGRGLELGRSVRSATLESASGPGESCAAGWSEEPRGRLRAALATAGRAGEETFEKVVPWIDRWVGRWSEARVSACRAAEVERTAPPEQAALERACMAERREELVALLEVLAEDPKSAAQRAVTAAASLTPVEACADMAALARRPAPPDDPAQLVRLGALRRDLLRIWGLGMAGRYADGLTRAKELRARAAAIGDAPLSAEAELQVGVMMGKLQQYDGAVQALERAFVAAGELGLDDLAATAANDLLFLVGHGQKRHEAATGWARAAEMFVGRVGQREGLLGIRYLNAMASYLKARGDLAGALPLYARALELCERLLGPDHPEIAVLLNNAGNTYESLGQSETAMAMFERGLALAERTLGEGHRLTMQLLSNYAISKVNAGDLDAAQALEERALALRERAFGPDHMQVGMSKTNLGQILLLRGDLAGARRVYEQALAIYERTLGPDNTQVAGARENLALVLAEQGSLEEAQALEEQALALRERLFGPDDPEVAWSLDNLSGIVRSRGAIARARELELRSLAIRERKPGTRELALSLNNFGAIELTRGDAKAAREALVRALEIREKTMRGDQPLIADTLRLLAEAERRTGALAEAEAHATRALTIVKGNLREDDRSLAGPLLVLGQVALDRGRADEAAPSLERALTLYEGRAAYVVEAAEARFALARALVALPTGAGRDAARAKALATEALAALRTFAGGTLPQRAAIEAWLRRAGK